MTPQPPCGIPHPLATPQRRKLDCHGRPDPRNPNDAPSQTEEDVVAKLDDGSRIGDRVLKPESLMMSYGYRPDWSEGALKTPIFQTSTFVFESAEEGKSFFELAYGLREQRPGESLGLIYSRLNNPTLEILEDRLTLWEQAEEAAVFESGMGAISTTVLSFLRPGSLLVFSEPVYGGTDHLFRHVLPQFGIEVIPFNAREGSARLDQLLGEEDCQERLAMIYVETPGNPTNDLVDIAHCAEIARRCSTSEKRVLVVVDNTFLGPLWQHPLGLGADLVVYSLTKFVGGHSDLIAGACLGPHALMTKVKEGRTFLGSMATPWTAWLLLRSLETLKLRMTRQVESAEQVARWLRTHGKIEAVHYLGLLGEGDPDYEVYRKQCLSPGSMISFDVQGGEAAAFRVLNRLKLIKLAVSLGSTESLAEHPYTMTHADVDPDMKREMGLTPGMLRLSVGVEDWEDIVADLEQALAAA